MDRQDKCAHGITLNPKNGLKWAPLGLALAVFFLLASLIALTKAPWCDEGWLANPAYNLAFHGNTGSNVLEPSGHFLNAYLSGIQQRTYVVPPNHFLALAGWFRLFGFSPFTTRAFSIVWAGIGLAAMFYIVCRLFGEPLVAALGALLTSIDFIYLWTAADGRMDAMVNSLMLASVAVYLYFRERNFWIAVIASQTLAACALFTHPNAALVLLAFTVIVWKLDRKNLRWQHGAAVLAIYAICALPWLIYISKAPHDFTAQFFANAAGRKSVRLRVILQPWIAVAYEFQRHIGAYMIDSLWSGVMNRWMMLVPVCLYFPASVWFVRTRKTLNQHARLFLAFGGTVVAAFTFLNGFKAHNYMNYFVPVYNTVFAAFLLYLWKGDVLKKLLGSVAAVAFLLMQLSTDLEHIRADEYRSEYLPAVETLKAYGRQGKTVVATSAFGFAMHYSGFVDDWRLGRYSGVKPDVIVLDRSYRDFVRRYELEEPVILSHYVTLFDSGYRLAHRHGHLWVYERVANGEQKLVVNRQDIYLKKDEHRAEYLLELISREQRDQHTQVESRSNSPEQDPQEKRPPL